MRMKPGTKRKDFSDKKRVGGAWGFRDSLRLGDIRSGLTYVGIILSDNGT
jgi:hypothetical protein